MKVLLATLLSVGAAPVEHPRNYLLSIERMPLKDTESIEAFAIKTWGVRFKSVCRIPSGWRITVGSSATPDGVIEGKGSQGATWFDRASPEPLRNFVLVTLYGPLQRTDIGTSGSGVPATFKGSATISTDDGDTERALTYKNIALVPADRCPNG